MTHDRNQCLACLHHGVDDDHCWWHGYEPINQGGSYYRLCIECGHCYRTAEELCREAVEQATRAHESLRHILDTTEELPPPPKAEEIFYCPLCVHDF